VYFSLGGILLFMNFSLIQTVESWQVYHIYLKTCICLETFDMYMLTRLFLDFGFRPHVNNNSVMIIQHLKDYFKLE